MKKSIVLFLVVSFACLSCTSKKENSNSEEVFTNTPVIQKMDHLFDSLTQNHLFSGNVLFADSTGVLFKKAYGLADYKQNISMKTNKKFQIASISKQFTAMGIMILKEQQKLDYDDSINAYLSDFPYHGISIRNLLTHTSGLPDFFDGIVDFIDHTKINRNADLYKLLVKHHPPVKANPNEKLEYNNLAYELLAIIIERVSGLSYTSFLSKYIFEPLKMSSTSSALCYVDSSGLYHVAIGYTWLNDSNYFTQSNLLKGREDSYYLSGMEGDGSLYSTVDDLYKWDQALKNGFPVSKETLNEAFAPAKMPNGDLYDTGWDTNYGFGWDISHNERLGKVVSHGGGQTGYRSSIARYLESGHTLIILCNIENDEFWAYRHNAFN